jgi:toxin ParE1/3/4
LKQHIISLSAHSVLDLQRIYDWLEAEAGDAIAVNYTKRIRVFIQKLEFAPIRGQSHEHLRKGLRSIGFERRVTVIFEVRDFTVIILRIFYGGRNWETEFDEQA